MNKLTQILIQKTSQTRLNTATTIIKLLSPSAYNWVNEAITNAHNTPRPFTKHIKQQYGTKPLTSIEIGFGHGKNAANLLKELNIKQLYCIDPYLFVEYQQESRTITTYKQNSNHNINYQRLLNDPRVTFLPFKSEYAHTLQTLKDQLFDFIYIDGNHTYQNVKQDLTNYWPLTKPEGYLGGHDYIFGQTGVIQAVQEFALSINQPPTINFPDYWFKKTTNENKQTLSSKEKVQP